MKKKILLFLFVLLFGIVGVKAENVAKVNDTEFETIALAITNANNGDTVVLLTNRSENITIPNGKDIILDLNGYTLSNKGNSTVITNNGKLKITNGTVTSSAKSGMINNNDGATLVITDGSYTATGLRQVLYNDKGTATIGGTAYLESSTTERATVHNLNIGKLYIVG